MTTRDAWLLTSLAALALVGAMVSAAVNPASVDQFVGVALVIISYKIGHASGQFRERADTAAVVTRYQPPPPPDKLSGG